MGIRVGAWITSFARSLAMELFRAAGLFLTDLLNRRSRARVSSGDLFGC
jgi:hypothetical protein